MDFMSLLDTASKNAKNMSKKLDDLKTEVDSERRAELKRIEAEKLRKMEILKKQKKASSPKPAEKEKKFIIPKKNKVTDEKDDKAKVMAFLAKKSEEERQLMEKKKAEKERLIQLRLQANGGKATKKMAKNFGMTAIDLQIKYGTNKEHVERLQKQKWREEEEQERIAAHYRDGVYKALAQKRKLDEKVQAGAVKLKPKHNGSTDKISSITASNRQHSDNYRPSSSSSSEPSEAFKVIWSSYPEKKIKTSTCNRL
ncbi:hypothetical protein KIN20_035297 [Parelaphostrongylus tenuis]|uniref:SPT2 homolog N-terminal domain-containing protein n=1 Tax=Parelaphostrongylus tenuis TaxID=148309 RepID=A0AAD5WJK6_PARTN|nr:hypothetical protein KIN20_035297 [Parelaphostrongylus tenuis]